MSLQAVEIPRSVCIADQGHSLKLQWTAPPSSRLSAAYLRRQCRCAGCEQSRRHGSPPIVPDRLRLIEARQFGVAGLQLVFSDGHRRGLFPWAYLRELAGASIKT
jgi:DUF971 family protein